MLFKLFLDTKIVYFCGKLVTFNHFCCYYGSLELKITVMKYLILGLLVYLALKVFNQKKISYNADEHEDEYVEYEEIDNNND